MKICSFVQLNQTFSRSGSIVYVCVGTNFETRFVYPRGYNNIESFQKCFNTVIQKNDQSPFSSRKHFHKYLLHQFVSNSFFLINKFCMHQ